jgi:hypothetical protein
VTEPDDLVDVHVLRMPVALWNRAQEQSDALLREFALISSETRNEASPQHVPSRLLTLVQELSAGYAGFTGEQEAALYAAADAGVEEIDLEYRVPRAVGAAAQALGRLLDEADEFCRAGQHLLTLAAPDELVRFRWWFLDQFADQAEGAPPVPWPEYRRSPA